MTWTTACGGRRQERFDPLTLRQSSKRPAIREAFEHGLNLDHQVQLSRAPRSDVAHLGAQRVRLAQAPGHLAALGRRRLLRGQPGGERPEHILDHGELAQLVLAELGDADRSGPRPFDQAILLQPPQRLAYRGRADVERLRQPSLRDLLPALQRAGDDGLADGGIRLIAESNRRGKLGKRGHGSYGICYSIMSTGTRAGHLQRGREPPTIWGTVSTADFAACRSKKPPPAFGRRLLSRWAILGSNQ